MNHITVMSDATMFVARMFDIFIDRLPPHCIKQDSKQTLQMLFPRIHFWLKTNRDNKGHQMYNNGRVSSHSNCDLEAMKLGFVDTLTLVHIKQQACNRKVGFAATFGW